MDLLQLAEKIASLGLVPVLVLGLIVVWRQWRKDLDHKSGTIGELAEQLRDVSEKRQADSERHAEKYAELAVRIEGVLANNTSATQEQQRTFQRFLDRGGN